MGLEYKAYYKSPIGLIEISANEDAITAVDFVEESTVNDLRETSGHPVLKKCIEQLDQYFRSERKEFSVKLQLQGTDFQNRVWKELLKVPFGKTASYRDIAEAAGNVKAVRAVGSANSKNRIAIIIPCHRIIGSDGSLTGYAGGLWRKEWLLRHEGIII